jgi:hypothetical protein
MDDFHYITNSLGDIFNLYISAYLVYFLGIVLEDLTNFSIAIL